ncbi:glycosyl transferase family 2 [Oceaniferula spumae]|uniref:Glycosyl transferase family 2 n=1 Tax=Oceaniferula spumae TaxID=2979115 RepID=A0AAT9FH97_9BACT
MARRIPKVSVVMPCYNAAGTVVRAVESIITQSFTDWELIVIDDGSQDDSANLVEAISKKLPEKIRLIRRPHLGVVGASNYGYSLAQAPLIARMDADDVSLPMRLEKQWCALQESPEIDIISCLVNFAGSHESAGGYAHHVDWANRQITKDQIRLSRFIDLPTPHPTLMFRKELLVNGPAYADGDFPEDYECFLRWIDRGAQVAKVPEVLFDWHDPSTRLSRNDARYDMEAFHRCKAPYLTKAIQQSGCGDRDLWIWGAGRPARKLAKTLERNWKKASGFVDVDPRKIGNYLQGRPVVAVDHLPKAENAVIVCYVASRGAGDVVRGQLLDLGRVEGIDFWIAA